MLSSVVLLFLPPAPERELSFVLASSYSVIFKILIRNRKCVKCSSHFFLSVEDTKQNPAPAVDSTGSSIALLGIMNYCWCAHLCWPWYRKSTWAFGKLLKSSSLLLCTLLTQHPVPGWASYAARWFVNNLCHQPPLRHISAECAGSLWGISMAGAGRLQALSPVALDP